MIDVDRSSDAPASLADGRRYDGDDVLDALHALFHGKCYLCETDVEVGTFEVDHRRPKADPRFSHLEFAWENLYPTCKQHGCNQRRLGYPDDGLLDPGQGVERRVAQRIEGTASVYMRRSEQTSLVFRAIDEDDWAAVRTAAELHHIHNASDSRRPNAARALRIRIFEHVVAITPKIHEYVVLTMNIGADPETMRASRDWVRERVSRRAPYSMLVRSYFSHLDPVRALFD